MARIESVLNVNFRFSDQIVGTDHVVVVNTDRHHVVHRNYCFEVENSKEIINIHFKYRNTKFAVTLGATINCSSYLQKMYNCLVKSKAIVSYHYSIDLALLDDNDKIWIKEK